MNHYIANEKDCHLANGTMYYPSETKEECLSYSYCWTPQSITTGILSPVDSTSGKCSEGITKSLFEWIEAKWIGGTWAFTNWTQRQAVAANTVQTTIDFPSLQKHVSSPSSISLKTYLQNQVRMK